MIIEQPIILKQSTSTTWFDIQSVIDSEKQIGGTDPDNSSLYQFTMGFLNPVNAVGDYIEIDNGDDIAVLTKDRNNILDLIKCGCVVNSKREIKAVDNSSGIKRFYISYDLTIEQRDWSFYPFIFNNLSFDNQASIQNLSDILPILFSSNYVRDDLGGVLTNGAVISKYLLLSDDIELQISEIEGTSREILNEILTALGYSWGISYIKDPDETNGVRIFQQVQIWQD